MADQYTETSSKSWGQNIGAAFSGVIIGLLLFLGSFAVLWNNEGAVNMSNVAKISAQVEASAVNSGNEGKFVSVTGTLVADKLGDPNYLKTSNYASLSRFVEMFAWAEESQSKTEDKVGGGSETTTTYTYKKRWTSVPQETANFKVPEGHANPGLPVKNATFYSPAVKVGAFKVDAKSIWLPSSKHVSITGSNIIPGAGRSLSDNYIFIKKSAKGTFQAPELGDLRISFYAVPSGIDVTAFGKQSDGKLVAYVHEGKDRIYRAFAGTREEALATMTSEFKMGKWMWRGIGFLMMWFGLSMFLGPINAFLKVLPILSDISKSVIGVVTFLVALVLSAVTITVAMIAHNIILLVITILVIIGAIVAFLKMRPAGKKA
ncbi:TMEM43 family protein [Candidatus Saganbacteria bacterium]|nr:TMEM43 family protein [Candidatus Saganbacteria bacterium]